mmetsp:Transcript_671/g.1331  ORF Transcript_671/g.1331 Transcript_671/m.1331 type:complete len:217 (-) Transcript_671:611-1261(-)
MLKHCSHLCTWPHQEAMGYDVLSLANCCHALSECQGRGQSRAFNSKEVDQSRNAVQRRALDLEIAERRPRGRRLGPDASVVRRQRVIRQRGVPLADGGIELVCRLRLNLVLHFIDPFHVGPELAVPSQVQCAVCAQAPRHRHRVDQVRERGRGLQAEVPPLSVVSGGDHGRWHSVDGACHRLSVDPCSIDDQVGQDAVVPIPCLQVEHYALVGHLS